MTQDQTSGGTQECLDCRTVFFGGATVCHACGGKNLRSRTASKFPHDAVAVFLGVITVILYWLARA
jgi:hypothetical protein